MLGIPAGSAGCPRLDRDEIQAVPGQIWCVHNNNANVGVQEDELAYLAPLVRHDMIIVNELDVDVSIVACVRIGEGQLSPPSYPPKTER